LAARRLVGRWLDGRGRVSVAVRRVHDAVEVVRGAVAGWHSVEVTAPPILYVGAERTPLAVPEFGPARAPATGDDVELRDRVGRGWALTRRVDYARLRQSIGRVRTEAGSGVAFLIAPSTAATSFEAIFPLPIDSPVTLEFPGVAVRGRVRATDAVGGAQIDL